MTLEVDNNDLYITGYLVEFPEDGEGLLLRDKLVFTGDEKDKYHTYKEGERLDMIAYNAYKDNVTNASKLWWVIADANNIFNPFELNDFIGKDLLIPNYDKVKLQL